MNIGDIYPKCRSFIERNLWLSLTGSPELKHKPDQFLNILKKKDEDNQIPEFLPDLAQIELMLYQMRLTPDADRKVVTELTVNPTLSILELKWKNLSAIFSEPSSDSDTDPEPGDEILLLWRVPHTGKEYIVPAASEDLLVLKMIIENIPAETIALSGNVPLGAVDEAVNRTVKKGLLLKPESSIRRESGFISDDIEADNQPMQPRVFTLQWHVTQACDLNCKHCYDRTDRSNLKLTEGYRILDDFRNFCCSRYVPGKVTFSGGNPLLYPHFKNLYRAASERGFAAAILGNPAPKDQIEELCTISQPSFYQVSLEGLERHNDSIRGRGHFKRVIAFLEILKDLNIYSMVMLTLTADNINEVIPLAEELRNRTNHFTFNRLSQVGEGANLKIPAREEYRSFLMDYLEAAENNPIMGLKDNLINILRSKQGVKTTGGCTGFGCGAAFNFLTLLPDGEVHACRKFPSLLGNVFENSLSEIYDSKLSQRYRQGSASCNSCPIKPSCGGCMASVYSHGLDIFNDRDPYCFI